MRAISPCPRRGRTRQGHGKVAGETGLARETLYRSLASDGDPAFKSMLAIMRVPGLERTSKRTEAE